MAIRNIARCFHTYDQKRRVFLKELSDLPSNLLSAHPGPNRWSLLQVLQHLVLAERVVLRGLPDHSELKHQTPGLRDRLGYLIVLGVLKWHIPVPVPSRSMLPEENIELDVLRRQWDDNMDWLSEYVKGLTQETAERAVFRHPVTGPLTPNQALRIARLHLDTHLRQAERIKKEINGDL